MTVAELCLALMRADTEEEVVALLVSAGYWDDAALWRYVGDTENNFGAIGNQQSEAVAALIEKLINGVDARLLDACLSAGVDPTSAAAPPSIRHAVATFFEDHSGALPPDFGSIALWPDSMATREADQLTLTATGQGPKTGSGLPCLTVADSGEGQTPDNFPATFLSLQKSNKLRVQFVQGKFNMGATGALQFCSPRHRLQLIVSRRNPALLDSPSARDLEWGFTIVRREPPSQGTRSSVFTYLAPIDVGAGRDGRVLSFAADEWPIFPRADKEGRDAYARSSSHGSLVKLYEYHLDGTRSNIVRSGGGLLQRVDFGMPELALPIRLYECRDTYRGHSGSFATNVLGVVARLDRDRHEKLEEGFPIGHVVRLEGREVRIRAYALKGSAREYRSGANAIVFAINGQTHATKTLDFFRRRNVGMSQLADSLIVVVDCTAIEGQLREDLFMNSRDRLREIELSSKLESAIEKFLHDDPTLRLLKNRRREEEIAEKLNDARPLADALTDLVRQTPGLSQLLIGGRAIPSPFPKSGTGDGEGTAKFVGKRFPTFFRFRNKGDGELLERVAHEGSTARLRFETDAEDDYFHRDAERGAFEVENFDSTLQEWRPLQDLSFTGPSSGIAGLSFELPEQAHVGDEVLVRIMVTDPSRIDAFVLEAHLRVAGPASTTPGTRGKDRKRNSGKGKGGDAGSVALPNIIPVHRDEWEGHGFDEMSALKVVGQGADDGGEEVFDFYVNYDNKHLLAAQKDPNRDSEALRAQFVYSLVLFSMSLLIDERSKGASGVPPLAADGDIEAVVGVVSRRLAPFVLPTLEAMSALVE
jgi:hypothetical protein